LKAEGQEQEATMEPQDQNRHFDDFFEQFGERMAAWGQEFGRRMEAWGEEFGQRMEGWAEELAQHTEQMGQRVGQWFEEGSPSFASADSLREERLTILRMLEEDKINVAEAESLLRALGE
jgi:DNA anti-recombination protein RmuC